MSLNVFVLFVGTHSKWVFSVRATTNTVPFLVVVIVVDLALTQ